MNIVAIIVLNIDIICGYCWQDIITRLCEKSKGAFRISSEKYKEGWLTVGTTKLSRMGYEGENLVLIGERHVKKRK